MIEIVPNWHPIFVHFTVALFVTSAIFYFLTYFSNRFNIGFEFIIVARWCLWFGTLITIGTVIAGFYAYYTVAHDTPSHSAMIDHRNWALVTSIVILTLTIWSWRKYRIDSKMPDTMFFGGMLIGLVLLIITAWHGGELVFRHGIGVMSLPQVTGTGHNHEHGAQVPHVPQDTIKMEDEVESIPPHTGHGHSH